MRAALVFIAAATITAHMTVDEIVRALELEAHPEGGFFVETFRSSLRVPAHGAERASSTAIYYLLPAHAFAAFHRVRSDEVWHHYAGAPVEVWLLDGAGARRALLGPDLAAGERPQLVVPASAWQACAPVGDGWALCGCTVAPGFDFADWTLASRAELIAQLPGERALVERFTRA
jgi:predicted cupin superfamily sugar epimerase